MKLKSIIALLGLTASVAAVADPFAPNSSAQSTINPAPGGEQNLQTIADNLFGAGHVNVQTQQSSEAFWTFATSSATSIPTMIAEFTANASSQSFGIWFGTDTNNIYRQNLLLGAANAGDNAAISISNGKLEVGSSNFASCFGRVNCGTFLNPLINPSMFGFYFQPSPSSTVYYSLDQLNPGPRKDRFVGFQDGGTTNWLFAYEDGTDFDYNDMAVKVESIKAAIPEPETYALMIAGLGAMGFVARRRKQQQS